MSKHLLFYSKSCAHCLNVIRYIQSKREHWANFELVEIEKYSHMIPKSVSKVPAVLVLSDPKKSVIGEKDIIRLLKWTENQGSQHSQGLPRQQQMQQHGQQQMQQHGQQQMQQHSQQQMQQHGQNIELMSAMDSGGSSFSFLGNQQYNNNNNQNYSDITTPPLPLNPEEQQNTQQRQQIMQMQQNQSANPEMFLAPVQNPDKGSREELMNARMKAFEEERRMDVPQPNIRQGVPQGMGFNQETNPQNQTFEGIPQGVHGFNQDPNVQITHQQHLQQYNPSQMTRYQSQNVSIR
jgi:hypothetical protein